MLLLELTSLDMDLAKLFYSAADGGFIGRYSFFLEDILHDRAKTIGHPVLGLGHPGVCRYVCPPTASSRTAANWAAWCLPRAGHGVCLAD